MLSVSQLQLGYDGQPLLRVDHLDIAAGSDCLILGPSGCGKTTLLYSLAGLLSPISGSIIINDTNITTLNDAARDRFRAQHVGIVFQTLHLVKSLTVLQNVMLAAYVAQRDAAKDRALALLAQLGLADKVNDLPMSLSQGQAQRVAIARAVMNHPAIILADEPTSSLDDDNCEAVLVLLKQAAREAGASLIISTHDQRITSQFVHMIELGGRA